KSGQVQELALDFVEAGRAWAYVGKRQLWVRALGVAQKDIVVRWMAGDFDPGMERALVGQSIFTERLAVDRLMMADNWMPAQQQQPAIRFQIVLVGPIESMGINILQRMKDRISLAVRKTFAQPDDIRLASPQLLDQRLDGLLPFRSDIGGGSY